MSGSDSLAAVEKRIVDRLNSAKRRADDDPKYSLSLLREWVGLICKFLELRYDVRTEAIASDGEGKLEARINRLQDFVVGISRTEIALLHEVRRRSNSAHHAENYAEEFFTSAMALEVLKDAEKFSKWFTREYCTKPVSPVADSVWPTEKTEIKAVKNKGWSYSFSAVARETKSWVVVVLPRLRLPLNDVFTSVKILFLWRPEPWKMVAG